MTPSPAVRMAPCSTRACAAIRTSPSSTAVEAIRAVGWIRGSVMSHSRHGIAFSPQNGRVQLALLSLLLVVLALLVWRAVTRERREYAQFKRMRSTAARQKV